MIKFKKSYLKRLKKIKKEVSLWPKWKFLGCDSLLIKKAIKDKEL